MYYEYLLKEAQKRGELKYFLTGVGEYKEKGDHFSDSYPLNCDSRFLFLCKHEEVNKKDFDFNIAKLIINLLRGSIEEFQIGFSYIGAMCDYMKEGAVLQIDYKSFLEEAKKILKSREKELKQSKVNSPYFSNTWEIIEYKSENLEKRSGVKLI